MYPKKEGGKRLDLVLLVNGFLFTIVLAASNFDNVARVLNFDEGSMKKVVTHIEEILSLNAELIDTFIEKYKGAKNAAKKVEIDLVARIRKHSNDPKFMRLGDKLEKLREQHEQGLINSIEFLKMLLELAREAAQAEKEVVPEEEIDQGRVTDIDYIVKSVRFDGWQNTTGGRQEVKKKLRSIVWVKYKIKDQEVFDKAYRYIEQYY